MENKLAKHREFFDSIRDNLTSEELSDYSSLKFKYVLGFFVSILTYPSTLALSNQLYSYNKSHKLLITFVVCAFPPVMINRFLRVYYMEPYFETIYKKYHKPEDIPQTFPDDLPN